MVLRPSLVRIIETDWAAFLGFLVPVVAWPVFLVLALLNDGRPPAGFMVGLLAALSLVAVAVLLWRIQLIRRVFAEGLEARATVCAAWFFRDRGRIEYIYTFQGQKYQGGNALHKTRRSAAYKPGDQVSVVVDASHPKRAFIRELYV